MKKQFILGFLTGVILCGAATVFAMEFAIEPNIYPIQVNGQNVNIEGYNINDYSYFKLLDVAAAVSNFDVDFAGNTIQLSKDGYVYDNTNAQDNAAQTISWENMVGEFVGENLNTIYLESRGGEPYLIVATYRGGDDNEGFLTLMDDGTLFYSNGGTRSFALKFIDNNTIELINDTWESQLPGKYTR